MRKLAHCDATFPCTDCVNFESCEAIYKKARTKRLKRRARLALFYVLAPFAWVLDLICKIFTSKKSATIAIIAITFAFGLSGYKASGDNSVAEPITVMAAEHNFVDTSTVMKKSIEVAALADEPTPPVTEENETPVTPAIEDTKPEPKADAEVLIMAMKEESTRRLAEEKAAAQAEAELQAQLELENEIHEKIFVHSQEVADEMGLLSDYDPILAMYGMRYLVTEEDFTIEGAAGLMGNVYSESKFKLGADNGSHFGIFQWDYYDRWPKISAYLEENGVSHYSRYQSYSDLTKEEQCEIFVWQLRASLHSSDAKYYSKTIENCRIDTSASSSADRWRKYYEVCDGCKQQRMDYAEHTANLYHSLFD